jgi:hypothetical protein
MFALCNAAGYFRFINHKTENMRNLCIILSSLTLLFLASCEKEDIEPQQGQQTQTNPKLPAGFEAWANLFGGEGVGAIHGHGAATFIFNLAGTKYAWFENEQIMGIRNVKADNSHFKNLALETVGAMAKVKWSGNNNSIMVYNAAGSKYTLITPKSSDAVGAFTDTEYFSFSANAYTPYDMYTDGTCPFNAIGAMYYYDFPSSCKHPELWFVNKEGTHMYYMQVEASTANLLPPITIGKHYLNNAQLGTSEVNSIGAISEITLSANNKKRVLFTGDGKQFKIWKYGTDAVSPLYNLY